MSLEWLALAACTGTDLDFFDSVQFKACKQTCATCQGRSGCLAYAMEMEQGNDARRFGVWGGLDPAERTALAKRRSAKVRSRK